MDANNHKFIISVKRDYRVDVVIAASSFEEAFEKAINKADEISFDDYLLVEEDPVHAEREDGKEADYGFHPYPDE